MKFKVGSRAFFEGYSDFNSHDSDYVLIENKPELYKTFAVIRTKDSDYFCYREMNKDEFLKFELEHCSKNKSEMAAGKLLTPELISYYNITLNDLKPFEMFINNFDNKHKYEKIIYNAYIENGDLFLTKSQLDDAYKEYKKYRN